MTVHACSKRVTFKHPFVLKGVEGMLPSGTYSVETRQEHTNFFSILKSKRTSTRIRFCRNPGIAGFLEVVNIDPLDLTAALMLDKVSTGGAGTELNKLVSMTARTCLQVNRKNHS